MIHRLQILSLNSSIFHTVGEKNHGEDIFKLGGDSERLNDPILLESLANCFLLLHDIYYTKVRLNCGDHYGGHLGQIQNDHESPVQSEQDQWTQSLQYRILREM